MTRTVSHGVPDLIAGLLNATEDEAIEFKSARSSFNNDRLSRIASALSNGHGGMIILGITDDRPRRVVGSAAYTPERARDLLQHACNVPVRARQIHHPDGSVLMIEVGEHRRGLPTQDGAGNAWMRLGDQTIPLSEQRRREIYAEAADDFSAGVCETATVADLSANAIETFRQRWLTKLEASTRDEDRQAAARIRRQPIGELLRDAELIVEDRLTWAALILFGNRDALGRYLAQSEIVFEYHATVSPGPPQERENLREGFFGVEADLWALINKRNDKQDYQSGLYVHAIPTFAERPVREAILNAVAHRDYQHPGSVFIRQYPRKLVCESPGGLPPGVTPQNILDRQLPRNRRIAEVFERCGLVERSGQGMDLMVTTAVRQSKLPPSLEGTDDHQVRITLDGEVQHPAFVQALESIGQETLELFDARDFLVLNHVRREDRVPAELVERAHRLRKLGILESTGRGRGARLILSRRLQKDLGTTAQHTRQRGLDREHNLELLLQHLRLAATDGAPFHELCQVLPNLSADQIRYRLRLLRDAGKVRSEGRGRAARWYLTSP